MREASKPTSNPWAANPQQWALAAGLPEPEEGETWIPYLFRLGLLDTDIEKLMLELTDRTAVLMPWRFTEYLREHGFRQHWDDYAEKRVRPWITNDRLLELSAVRGNLNRHHTW